MTDIESMPHHQGSRPGLLSAGPKKRCANAVLEVPSKKVKKDDAASSELGTSMEADCDEGNDNEKNTADKLNTSSRRHTSWKDLPQELKDKIHNFAMLDEDGDIEIIDTPRWSYADAFKDDDDDTYTKACDNQTSIESRHTQFKATCDTAKAVEKAWKRFKRVCKYGQPVQRSFRIVITKPHKAFLSTLDSIVRELQDRRELYNGTPTPSVDYAIFFRAPNKEPVAVSGANVNYTTRLSRFNPAAIARGVASFHIYEDKRIPWEARICSCQIMWPRIYCGCG